MDHESFLNSKEANLNLSNFLELIASSYISAVPSPTQSQPELLQSVFCFSGFVGFEVTEEANVGTTEAIFGQGKRVVSLWGDAIKWEPSWVLSQKESKEGNQAVG